MLKRIEHQEPIENLIELDDETEKDLRDATEDVIKDFLADNNLKYSDAKIIATNVIVTIVIHYEDNKINKVKNSYPDGICPDCGANIPDDVEDGDECMFCEHIFYEEV